MKSDMKYFIAYKDENGKDFKGLPYIAPDESGFSNIENIQILKDAFEERKFKTVKVFACDDMFQLPEEITWDFVNEHLIN